MLSPIEPLSNSLKALRIIGAFPVVSDEEFCDFRLGKVWLLATTLGYALYFLAFRLKRNDVPDGHR